jgi:hypothetical protein
MYFRLKICTRVRQVIGYIPIFLLNFFEALNLDFSELFKRAHWSSCPVRDNG